MTDVDPIVVLGGRGAFAVVEGVSISILAVERWTIADVDAYMAACFRVARDVTSVASLSHFLADVPGAAARKRMLELIEREGVTPATRTALLTDAALMRGAATAWGWLTQSQTLAVAPEELRRAIEWCLQGTRGSADRVERVATDCYGSIGIEPPTRARR